MIARSPSSAGSHPPLARRVRTASAIHVRAVDPRERDTTGAMAVDASKRRGAVLGGLVADAATMGLHWIYDTSKLQALLQGAGRAGSPEFFEPPSCPFYQMPSGALSPYGAELAALLHHMTQHRLLEGQSWAKALRDYFTNVYPGYKNHSIKTLIAQLAEGKQYPNTGDASDFQANCLCKVKGMPTTMQHQALSQALIALGHDAAPQGDSAAAQLPLVTAVYAGQPQLEQQLEVAARAQQSNDNAARYGVAAGRILEKVLLGSSVEGALQWAAADGSMPSDVSGAVKEVLQHKATPFNDAVKVFGASCAMPGAFKSALLAALTAGSYVEGVRLNALAGGDNCSRGIYVGALLGAAHGEQGIPAEWRAKVADHATFDAALQAIFST